MMPWSNTNTPRPPVPDYAKTDLQLSYRLKQTTNAKRKRVNTSRCSAPAGFAPPFVYPAAPASLFLSLTAEIFPGDISVVVDAPSLADSHPVYLEAVTRLSELVAGVILTINESKLLQASMTVAQSLVASGEVHGLLETIVSPSTPDSAILNLSSVVDAGLKAFIAHPGPSGSANGTASDNGSSGSVGSRHEHLKRICAARDCSTCVVTGVHTGSSSYIIPFSVRGETADHFWALVAMFKGLSATQLLKTVILGYPPRTDNMRNVIWLSHAAHADFNSGKLAIVPVLTSDPYDPSTVCEYDARIELSFGENTCELPVLTTSADGKRRMDLLRSGHTITLRTSNPAIHPLPHPILLQLHTAFTRLLKLCASSGIPILPEQADSEGDEEMALSDYYSEVDYQIMVDGGGNASPPQSAENDMWPTTTLGLPLKEQFLQLLCGSEDSESEHYYNVMDHWTLNNAGSLDVELEERNVAKDMLERKRAHEQLDRDETASERSRPVTELMRSTRRWDSPVEKV